MVSSEYLRNTLRSALNALKQLSIDDSFYQCKGALGDLVFDLVTLDSGIAGIAERIIEGGPAITVEERIMLLEREFLDGTVWKGINCICFDLVDYPTLLDYAKNIENVRILCFRTVNSL